MKPDDPNKSQSDFEKDLGQLEQQYRALDQDQPPAMLDQAILNKAKLAVEPHSARPWSFGWMHLTATAGVLVLGLTLVLQQRSEVPQASERLRQTLPMTLEADSTGAGVESSRAQDGNEILDSIGEILVEGNSPYDDQRAADDYKSDQARATQFGADQAKLQESDADGPEAGRAEEKKEVFRYLSEQADHESLSGTFRGKRADVPDQGRDGWRSSG